MPLSDEKVGVPDSKAQTFLIEVRGLLCVEVGREGIVQNDGARFRRPYTIVDKDGSAQAGNLVNSEDFRAFQSQNLKPHAQLVFTRSFVECIPEGSYHPLAFFRIARGIGTDEAFSPGRQITAQVGRLY